METSTTGNNELLKSTNPGPEVSKVDGDALKCGEAEEQQLQEPRSIPSPPPPPPPPPPPLSLPVPKAVLPAPNCFLNELKALHNKRLQCDTTIQQPSANETLSEEDSDARDITEVSSKPPGKLFEQRGEDETPNVSLKDYEEQSLREIARERQRIIQNQVVRRKTIHQWLFSDRQKDPESDVTQQIKKPEPPVKRKGKLHAIQKHWQSVTSKLTLKKSAQPGQRICTLTSNDKTQFVGHYKMTSEQDLIVFDSELMNGNMKDTEGAGTPVAKQHLGKKGSVENNGVVTESEHLPNGNVISESSILLVDLSGGSGDGPKAVNGGVSASMKDNFKGGCDENFCSENSAVADSTFETVGKIQSVNGSASTVEVLKETEVLQTEAIKEVVEITITPSDDQLASRGINGDIGDRHVKESNEIRVNAQQDCFAGMVQSNAQVAAGVYRSTLTLSEKVLSNGIKDNKTEKSYNSHSAETKIAMEIREMREREDELRNMRERHISSTPCPDQNGHVQSDGSVKSDDVETPSGSESPQEMPNIGFRDHREIARAVSLDSLHLGQTYNIGYVFAHRRRENIKVRPLADEDNTEDKPVFASLDESPIEREIRLAKEREEELKKEKSLICNGIKSTTDSVSKAEIDDKSKTVVDGAKQSHCVIPESTKQEIKRNGIAERPKTIELNGKTTKEVTIKRMDSSPIEIRPSEISPKVEQKGVLTTQKLIATSRIQQEIEEQTKREMALRESGQIQTISQERTDSKVTRLAEVTSSSPVDKDKKPPIAKTPVIRDSSPTIEIYEKPISNGHTNGTVQANGNSKSPSSTTSSSSSSSKPLLPATRRLSNPSSGRNVSMQRFIASRGKEITFCNGLPGDRVAAIPDYYEIKPPQVRRGDGKPHRRSVTAESRIQEELKEMKAREEELKRQRSRLLGLSQPNLSVLVDEDDAGTNGNCEEEVPMERCNSNPNLLENGVVEDVPEPSVGGPRRRSILIDQWEQRIMSTS